ncbi:MAG TPA: hypothetical protein VNB64_13630 [Solirubrobacteraceae bacterium]|nr:hypothetical protein [Solirubrobacteraceae bacterium]
MPRIGTLVLVAGCLTALLLPASAPAALRAKTSVVTAGGASRLVVNLTSTTPLTVRTRPRSVRVRVGQRFYALGRVPGARATVVSAGVWRSAAYRGAAGLAVARLVGRPVRVLATSLAGTANLASIARRPPAPPGPTPPGPTPPGPTPPGPNQPSGPTGLFEPPGRTLTGQETVPFLQRYFHNSRFTDCPNGGWPNCAVEYKYVHCSDGGWQYHRNTNTSGADIHSYGTFEVTGATVNPDGSWAVEYNQTAYGSGRFYHWEVATNGYTVGYEVKDGQRNPLGPYQWQQPGGCDSPY